ncbi:hypothetical protein, partial [Bradyrhizobium sp.]|uniref:hypothetical protein n=1 Tax=Bradyrhizobium sp. TaxID=376 RepID=UPI003C454839
IKSVRVEGLNSGGSPRAIITIKNSGVTPARNVTHRAKMGFSTFPKMTPMPERGQVPSPPGAIAPGGEINMSTGIDKPLNDATLIALLTGTHAIYVVGEIRYDDAFGKMRETDFHLFCTRELVNEGTMASFDIGNRIT